MSRRQEFEFDGLYEETTFQWDFVNLLRVVVLGLVLCVVGFEFGVGVAFTDRCTVAEDHGGCDLEFQCVSGARHRGAMTYTESHGRRSHTRCLRVGEDALANPFWWDRLRNDGPFSFFQLSLVAVLVGGAVGVGLGYLRAPEPVRRVAR